MIIMSQTKENIVTANRAKSSAKLFNYGNILSVLIPFPIFILWFGASIVFYAMFRHHPNPRVGYYTQIAAYQYYGFAGVLIPVLTFAPGDFFKQYWLIMWLVCVVIMVPLAIIQIVKINREKWEDVTVEQ